MRILDKYQLIEEKLPQITLLNQANQAKELKLYQVAQAQVLSHSLKSMEMEKVKPRDQHQLKLQRRLPFCNHRNTSIELTPIPQT
jgi:hypothetical protein